MIICESAWGDFCPSYLTAITRLTDLRDSLEAPSSILVLILNVVRAMRKFVLRHLSLPRPSFLAVKVIDDKPNPLTGTYNFNHYKIHPWYVKPSIRQRWGPKAWLVKLFGKGVLPGDQGDTYRPQGYDLRTVGPAAQDGKGMAEMSADIEKLKAQDRIGCPFAF
jgi:hypothetical protein